MTLSYLQVTYAPWPTSPYHNNFYQLYISGRSYESKYTSLRNRAHSRTNAHETDAASRLVNQNFLTMQLNIDEQLMMEYEARAQLSLTAFLSQLGGALNLWAGITVVVFVEILEFGYHLMVDFNKGNTGEDERVPVQDPVTKMDGLESDGQPKDGLVSGPAADGKTWV